MNTKQLICKASQNATQSYPTGIRHEWFHDECKDPLIASTLKVNIFNINIKLNMEGSV
jgi:hypothetical protein